MYYYTTTHDPVVGRFLSPDPYVQDPSTPQNFNRYSYCLNNPLKYTDPCGFYTSGTDRLQGLSGREVDSNSYGGGGGGEDGITGRNPLTGQFASNSTYQAASIQWSFWEFMASLPDDKSSGSTEDFVNEIWEVFQTIGADEMIFLNTVNVIAYDQDSYDKAAQNIAEQIWGGTGSSAYSASSALSNSLGRAISAGGVAKTAPVASVVNSIINSFASSINKNAPKARFGSNGKFYWSGKFKGNQYVITKAVSTFTKPLANVTIFLGIGISGYQIWNSYQTEGYWGPQTQAIAVSEFGGTAGAFGGAAIGAAIGVNFGGVGAIPGSVIGGFIGGVSGSFGGSLAADKAFQYYKSK